MLDLEMGEQTLARRAALFVVVAVLSFPGAASAHGDPASDYLLAQDLFLPFNAKIDSGTIERLQDVIKGAEKGGFKIKVALISTRYDLGTAFSLYRKPQRYAEFLGLELSFRYRGRLLVVMPNGFGFSINGEPQAHLARALQILPEPGVDATKQARAAAGAVRRLASTAGFEVVVSNGGGSETRDRIIIAAAAVAILALIAAVLILRRQHRPRPD
jgi:hypothetical protein